MQCIKQQTLEKTRKPKRQPSSDMIETRKTLEARHKTKACKTKNATPKIKIKMSRIKTDLHEISD